MEKVIALEADFETPKEFNEQLLYFSKKSPFNDSSNEDAVAVVKTELGYILAVADGAGGHPKGEEAAALVLKNIVSAANSLGKGQNNYRALIVDAIDKTNRELIKSGVGARTTVSVCEISSGLARGYQVGDSTLVICGQKGKLKYRSLSHSPVGYGVEAGLIEEAEALSHPDLHYISNLVGENDMKIEIGPEVELSANDSIFLASDGIFDNFAPEQIIELIRKGSLQTISQDLMGLIKEKIYAEESSKKDDISFILFKN